MKLDNPTLDCLVYCGQPADSTLGTQMCKGGGLSNHPLDVILHPAAKDMINDIGEGSDDDTETWRPNPRSVMTTKSDFQQVVRQLQRSIMRQQRYLEDIRRRALRLFADDEQRVVADEDMAWLGKQDHIMNPPAVGSLANWKCTSSCPGSDQSL